MPQPHVPQETGSRVRPRLLCGVDTMCCALPRKHANRPVRVVGVPFPGFLTVSSNARAARLCQDPPADGRDSDRSRYRSIFEGVGQRKAAKIAGLSALLCLLVLLIACGQAAPENTALNLPDSYLLADDFSPPHAAWVRFDTDESAVYTLAGELYLEDRGKGTAVYSPLKGENYADVAVDVRVRHVQGTVDNWMGVLCRFQDEENYYLLAISADGYYLILQVAEGVTLPLSGPAYSEAILRGKAENALRVRCESTRLSLWANEELLVTQESEALNAAGEVALFADAVAPGASLVVAFDGFILSAP